MKQLSPVSKNIFIKYLHTGIVVFMVALLSACQKGDLSGLNEESIVAALGLVSIAVEVREPVTPTSGPISGPIMPVEGQQQFDVTGLTDTGTEISFLVLNSKVAWTVSESALAAIDSNGLLTAKAEGAIEVTAKLGSLPPSPPVIINSSQATSNSITVSVNDTTAPTTGTDIRLCQLTQLKAEAVYTDDSDGTTFNWDVTNEANWSNGNADAATTIVDNTNAKGLVAYTPTTRPDATAPPTMTINANIDGVTSPGVTSLNVLFTNDDFTSMEIASPTTQLSPGTFTQLTATANRLNSSDDITRISTWGSDTPSVISTDPNIPGQIKGEAASTTTSLPTITASCGGVSATIKNLSVADTKKLERIEITQDANRFYNLNRNSTDSSKNTKQLEAKAYYSDGTDAPILDNSTPNPVWSAKPINVATNNASAASIINLNVNTGNVDTISTTNTGVVLVTLSFDGKQDDIVFIVNP